MKNVQRQNNDDYGGWTVKDVEQIRNTFQMYGWYGLDMCHAIPKCIGSKIVQQWQNVTSHGCGLRNCQT